MDANRKLLPFLLEELLGQGYFLINNNAGLMGQITTHYQPIDATRSLYLLYLENNGERLSPEVRFTLAEGKVVDREIPQTTFPPGLSVEDAVEWDTKFGKVLITGTQYLLEKNLVPSVFTVGVMPHVGFYVLLVIYPAHPPYANGGHFQTIVSKDFKVSGNIAYGR